MAKSRLAFMLTILLTAQACSPGLLPPVTGFPAPT